ncbi:putative reverse transcriptase domain-containing protein [Tanacetum coccineum]|uniref:Reverse transcriptase domain-containing protein n=1 Tax=Tanacetum coccineum TaxID=301880 RepID=A0ABQ5DBF0_9ASTR
MAPKRATRSTRAPPTPNETTTTVTEAQLQALIDQGVAAALAEAEASRARNGYNSNGSGPRPAQTARECSYSEFLKCKPLDFKGTEGVVGLTRWFEKMESVFSISNCPATSQVKFATCTLQDDALTWWNAHVKTTTTEAAHAMPWAALKKMMTDKYCPRGEIKKIETEMWNLKVKGTDVVAYSRRFQQLALMCSRMFPEEIDKVEKYIGGLPDMILGSVKASKSKTARDATRRNGTDSHSSGTGVRGSERVTRECTYQDFMKCKPLYFKGTEGVVELTQWFERMETVFRISNCSAENQIKFATCTLLAGALTWWNTHVMTVTHDVAYSMTWVNLKKKMTDKYCPRNEMKKLEAELWNLKVIGTDVVKYNQRFQELALLCVRMFPEEADKIERYVGGLPDMIHGNIVASKPKTMQEAIEMATELMDKRVSTMAERQAENKRKSENTSRSNQNQQQQPNKRQNTGRAYTAGSGDKKPYGGSRPLCSKCNYHHDGPCAPKCYKCNKYGHIARDCRGTGNVNNNNNQKGTGSGQKPTCFECGAQGHFKKECPRLKNNKGNRGNQAGNDRAPAKVYVVGNAGANPDNVVAGTFLLNNRYAYILFDTGADRSFVSTAFSSQIDITPSTLDHYYDVELADGRIIGLNTILKGCTLNFLNHQFNINLMPVELGSFDAIIGMDWLAKHQAVIMCAEKIVRIPWKNKTLIVHGDGSTQGNVTRLNIISCTKTQRYLEKGFPIFLAHVTTKEVEDSRLNKQEHEEHLKLILELLKKEELYAKFSKCEFWISIRVLLGIISKEIHWKGFQRSPNTIGLSLLKRGQVCLGRINKGLGFSTVKAERNGAVHQSCLPLEGSEQFHRIYGRYKKGLGAVLMKREKRRLGRKKLEPRDDGNPIWPPMAEVGYLVMLLKTSQGYDTMWVIVGSDSLSMRSSSPLGDDLGINLQNVPKGGSGDREDLQTLEDMLCACAIVFGKGWVDHFAIRSSNPPRPKLIQETTEKSSKSSKDASAREANKGLRRFEGKTMDIQVGISYGLKFRLGKGSYVLANGGS